MNGNIEVGKCEVCGKENIQLERRYFNYDLQCKCHSPNHFEMVSHCKDCKPKEPTYTKVSLLTKDLKKIEDKRQDKMAIKMDLPNILKKLYEKDNEHLNEIKTLFERQKYIINDTENTITINNPSGKCLFYFKEWRNGFCGPCGCYYYGLISPELPVSIANHSGSLTINSIMYSHVMPYRVSDNTIILKYCYKFDEPNILDILEDLTCNLSGILEVSEDEGSFNIVVNSHNSFNFDYTYTTIIIHNNMPAEKPDDNNTLAYLFTSYEWKWLAFAKVNNKDMTNDDYKELFNYLRIAGLNKI